jgi:ureidoglycolate hydrolase
MPFNDEMLLEIHDYDGYGYQPLVDYASWRVAMLRYDPELEADAIDFMQKHNETDEVFVLLAGQCILFIGTGDDEVDTIYAREMQPLKLYNVKRGVWHSHTLSRDASVLVIENRDTTPDNSPRIELTKQQRKTLVALTEQVWR